MGSDAMTKGGQEYAIIGSEKLKAEMFTVEKVP